MLLGSFAGGEEEGGEVAAGGVEEGVGGGGFVGGDGEGGEMAAKRVSSWWGVGKREEGEERGEGEEGEVERTAMWKLGAPGLRLRNWGFGAWTWKVGRRGSVLDGFCMLVDDRGGVVVVGRVEEVEVGVRLRRRYILPSAPNLFSMVERERRRKGEEKDGFFYCNSYISPSPPAGLVAGVLESKQRGGFGKAGARPLDLSLGWKGVWGMEKVVGGRTILVL